MTMKQIAAGLCGFLIFSATASPVFALSYQTSDQTSGSAYASASDSLVNDGGTIYFISGATKVPFTSWGAFTGLGYSIGNVINGDLSGYSLSQGYSINTPDAIHPWGQWLVSGGTVYYSVQAGLIPVPSAAIFSNNGGQWNLVVKANKYDLAESTSLPLLTDNDTRVITAPNYNFSGQPANSISQTPTTSPTTTVTASSTLPSAPSNIRVNGAYGSLNPPTLDASSTAGQFMLANAQNQPMAVFDFTASGSPATIQELDFTIQTNAVGASTLPVTEIMASGGTDDITGYSTSSISGLNVLVPSDGSTVKIPVNASVAGINPPNSPSNQIFSVNLSGITYLTGGQSFFMSLNLPSNSMDFVGSIPSLSVSGPSGTLMDGLTLLGQVTISASGGVGITVDKLPVTITSTGNAAASSSPNNLVVTDGGASVSTTNAGINFAPGGSSSDTIVFGSDNFIPAGTSKTYSISLTLTGQVGSAGGLSTVGLSLGSAGGFTFNDFVGQNSGLNIPGSTGNISLPGYPTNIVTAHN